MNEFAVFLTSMILLGVFTVFCIAVDLASYIRKKNVIKPVEFYAPEGYSPIDAALVYSARGLKAPEIVTDLAASVQGRDVILIEDIVDSGYTLVRLKDLILERGAKSFTAVTLFDKPARRKLPVRADFSCFEIGDEFIVGYGLDYAQQYRNLPYAGILKREIYEKNNA